MLINDRLHCVKKQDKHLKETTKKNRNKKYVSPKLVKEGGKKGIFKKLTKKISVWKKGIKESNDL